MSSDSLICEEDRHRYQYLLENIQRLQELRRIGS